MLLHIISLTRLACTAQQHSITKKEKPKNIAVFGLFYLLL